MFIATETLRHGPSSVRSGIFGVQWAANAVAPVVQTVPLLTELVSVEDGFHYKHGAPDGAFACFTPPKTARNGFA
jgi:hypothetical protein